MCARLNELSSLQIGHLKMHLFPNFIELADAPQLHSKLNLPWHLEHSTIETVISHGPRKLSA